jgi:hypothetical protein
MNLFRGPGTSSTGYPPKLREQRVAGQTNGPTEDGVPLSDEGSASSSCCTCLEGTPVTEGQRESAAHEGPQHQVQRSIEPLPCSACKLVGAGKRGGTARSGPQDACDTKIKALDEERDVGSASHAHIDACEACGDVIGAKRPVGRAGRGGPTRTRTGPTRRSFRDLMAGCLRFGAGSALAGNRLPRLGPHPAHGGHETMCSMTRGTAIATAPTMQACSWAGTREMKPSPRCAAAWAKSACR